MITIDLTHPGYKEMFADAEVGDTRTVTFTISEKSDEQIVGEIATDEYDSETPESAEETPVTPSRNGKKTPRGVLIAISQMKS